MNARAHAAMWSAAAVAALAAAAVLLGEDGPADTDTQILAAGMIIAAATCAHWAIQHWRQWRKTRADVSARLHGHVSRRGPGHDGNMRDAT